MGGRPVQWHVAMRAGRRRLLKQDGARWLRERDKASVRAKVEHPFLYVKPHFGYRKVRYRELAKNTERIALLLAGRYSTARAAGAGSIRPRGVQLRDHQPEHADLARFQPVIAPKTTEADTLRPAPPPERPCSELPWPSQ